MLALAARFPSLYAALGLHPIVIERHADDDPDKLQQALAQQQNVVAVGEIGLDLYRDDPQFAARAIFRRATATGKTLRSAGDPALAAHA